MEIDIMNPPPPEPSVDEKQDEKQEEVGGSVSLLFLVYVFHESHHDLIFKSSTLSSAQ